MLNSVSSMVFHFGCELHERYSFFHMLANGCREGMNEDGVKEQKAETMRKKKGRERQKGRQTERQAGRQTSECHEEGEMEKVFDGRSRRREEEGEGGRGSTVHAPLPMQRGLLPGGTQTLSPCPALYSPGYCSQINLACYPV